MHLIRDANGNPTGGIAGVSDGEPADGWEVTGAVWRVCRTLSDRPAGPALAPVRRHFRMFTARATTITASERLIADCTSISIFAQRLSGSVSVGLNAAAFVKDT